MNVNEVIANRALELAGHPRGDYAFIHPNDHVNHSQSTNDTYPAACKLAIIDALGPLTEQCRNLARAFHALADKHIHDVTIGRTQLQDAVPMTFGQEFHHLRHLPEDGRGRARSVGAAIQPYSTWAAPPSAPESAPICGSARPQSTIWRASPACR